MNGYDCFNLFDESGSFSGLRLAVQVKWPAGPFRTQFEALGNVGLGLGRKAEAPVAIWPQRPNRLAAVARGIRRSGAPAFSADGANRSESGDVPKDEAAVPNQLRRPV